MEPSLTELQAQLSALRSIRADGLRTVRFGDDEISYRSDAELAAAIGDLERRIGDLIKPTSRIVYPRCRKGYHP